MRCAIPILVFLVILPHPATGQEIPLKWLLCSEDDDCTKLERTCMARAINEKYAEEASKLLYEQYAPWTCSMCYYERQYSMRAGLGLSPNCASYISNPYSLKAICKPRKSNCVKKGGRTYPCSHKICALVEKNEDDE